MSEEWLFIVMTTSDLQSAATENHTYNDFDMRDTKIEQISVDVVITFLFAIIILENKQKIKTIFIHSL